VRQLLRDAEDVDCLVDLKNSLAQWVVGVTPLYLAAQVGGALVGVCLWGRERAGNWGEGLTGGSSRRSTRASDHEEN
jgi:hypothetical protein